MIFALLVGVSLLVFKMNMLLLLLLFPLLIFVFVLKSCTEEDWSEVSWVWQCSVSGSRHQSLAVDRHCLSFTIFLFLQQLLLQPMVMAHKQCLSSSSHELRWRWRWCSKVWDSTGRHRVEWAKNEREREKRRKRVTPSCRSLPSYSLLLLCFVVLGCVCLPFSTIADTHQLTSVCLSVSGSFLIRRHKICLLMLLQQLLLLMQCSGIQWWRRLRCNFTTMLQSSHVLLMFWGDQQCNDVPNLSVLVTRCHYHCTLHLGRWRHFAGVSLLFCLASLLEFFHIDPVMSLCQMNEGVRNKCTEFLPKCVYLNQQTFFPYLFYSNSCSIISSQKTPA